MMTAPGVLSRSICSDCVLHAYGCDSVLEDSCILIQGRSVEEVPEGVEVPQAKGWNHGRMDVRAFKAKIEVLSPTSARTSIVANIDPNAPVPQAVVNFVVRALSCNTNRRRSRFVTARLSCNHANACDQLPLTMRSSGAQSGWNVSLLPEANR